MPQLKLTNLASYKQYWQDIATKHKLLNGASYYGDKDVVSNELRSNAKTLFLWITPYPGTKYGDQLSDNIVKKKTATVAVMKKVDDNKFATVENTFQYCEAIVEDIVSKLIKDNAGEDVSGVWTMISINTNTIQSQPVEQIFGSLHYIGCELSVEFNDNTALQYDASKWN